MAKRPDKWERTVGQDALRSYIYKREAWEYRYILRWWTDAAGVRQLLSELSRTFSVKEPACVLQQRASNVTTGYYRPHQIRLTSPRDSGLYEYPAADRRCREWLLGFRVQGGTYPVMHLLHEFAHHLCYVWWRNGQHGEHFASVSEALYRWYGRKRRKNAERRPWKRRRTETK